MNDSATCYLRDIRVLSITQGLAAKDIAVAAGVNAVKLGRPTFLS